MPPCFLLHADTLVVIKQQGTAGVLKPAFVVVADHTLHAVVLAIRGTTSFKDLFTSLAGKHRAGLTHCVYTSHAFHASQCSASGVGFYLGTTTVYARHSVWLCLSAAATKPHHVVAPDGVVLGYSHLGMLAAARWLIKQVGHLAVGSQAVVSICHQQLMGLISPWNNGVQRFCMPANKLRGQAGASCHVCLRSAPVC